MNKNENIYVRVLQSNYLRKSLLQASVSAIMLLQRHHHIKLLKIEKLKEFEKLNDSFKKIHRDFNALKRLLPQIEYKKEAPPVEKKPVEEKKPSKKEEFKGLDKEEISLEMQLREIEQKLQQLS